MRRTFKLVACAALVLSTGAFAGGDKAPMNEEGTGGSGAVQADPAVLEKMKAETQQALKKHKAWIDQNVSAWPEKTKEVIAKTIDSYGPPKEVTDSMLVWGKTGPWKRTIIYREVVEHKFPMPHEDVMEQFVDFQVPPDKFDDLAQYDGSVIAERTKGELSARCDQEPANLLAINLAADVANGKRTADEARDYYAKAIRGMLKGQMDPYLKSLKVEKKGGETADADKARFANPMRQQAHGRSKPVGR